MRCATRNTSSPGRTDARMRRPDAHQERGLVCEHGGYMKAKNANTLILAEHWASLAIGFGLGYLALSHFRYGGIIAWVLVSVGALLKAMVHSRLVKLQH